MARASCTGSDELRREYEAALCQKNAQIEAFRVDLDGIMEQLMQLHAQQAEAVATG